MHFDALGNITRGEMMFFPLPSAREHLSLVILESIFVDVEIEALKTFMEFAFGSCFDVMELYLFQIINIASGIRRIIYFYSACGE